MKEVSLYTDGACSGNPGPGGYGAVLLYRQCRRELSGGYAHTTNNRMELRGVIAGLQALREPCDVVIYSDSSYVVNAFAKGWLTSWQRQGWRRKDRQPVLNTDLWQELLQALQPHRHRFVWVKGHADNPENCRCDALARQALAGPELLPDRPAAPASSLLPFANP